MCTVRVTCNPVCLHNIHVMLLKKSIKRDPEVINFPKHSRLLLQDYRFIYGLEHKDNDGVDPKRRKSNSFCLNNFESGLFTQVQYPKYECFECYSFEKDSLGFVTHFANVFLQYSQNWRTEFIPRFVMLQHLSFEVVPAFSELSCDGKTDRFFKNWCTFLTNRITRTKIAISSIRVTDPSVMIAMR